MMPGTLESFSGLSWRECYVIIMELNGVIHALNYDGRVRIVLRDCDELHWSPPWSLNRQER